VNVDDTPPPTPPAGASRAAHALAVHDFARTLGFDACGVAAVDGAHTGDCLDRWLALGYHADMDWIAASRAARKDVRARVQDARSVVVVAANYYAPDPPRATKTGIVARYARGKDYHRALKKPLIRLARFIDTLAPGSRSYASIDSGPVLERTWAARAGVGWVGKNSLILRRDLGSYFFLATVITAADLAPSDPVADHCGSCRACMDACPTDAIVEDRVVDANRCISYQTIENRGEIPEDIARKHGDWVFGCDICQEVCPWNRKAPNSTWDVLTGRPEIAFPSLTELAEIDDATFKEMFAGTPVRRAKGAGMRQNAQIALANLQRVKTGAVEPGADQAAERPAT